VFNLKEIEKLGAKKGVGKCDDLLSANIPTLLSQFFKLSKT